MSQSQHDEHSLTNITNFKEKIDKIISLILCVMRKITTTRVIYLRLSYLRLIQLKPALPLVRLFEKSTDLMK